MGMDGRHLLNLISRYKKQLIIGAVALSLTFVAGVSLLTFIVYKSFAYSSDKVAAWSEKAGEKIENLELPADVVSPPTSFVETFLLTAASQWLEQGLASEETAQIKNALACFDAVGGPSPQAVVGYLQTQVSEERIVGKLADLSQVLTKEFADAGPSACANWVLNG